MPTIAELLTAAVQQHQAGNLPAAERLYRQILAVEPKQADAVHLLGLMAHQTGQPAVAVDFISRAIRLRGNVAAFHNNLGEAYLALGKQAEAVASYRRAIELQKDMAEAHNNLGNALKQQGKLDEAIASFRRAVKLKPRYAEPHNNLGNVHLDRGELDKALASYQRAIELRPDYAKPHYNIGVVYQLEGKSQEAAAAFRRAIELRIDLTEAHNNLGNALVDLGKLDEALTAFDRAIELQPEFAEAHVSRSVVLLLRQNWQLGWADYEYRRRVPQFARTFDQPAWQGESLAGKTILLYAEQGLGDTIQFVRYAPLVRRRGARVVLECQRALLPLIETAAGIDQLVPAGDELPKFNVQAALLSLPGIFATTAVNIPAPVPYLHADPARVESWKVKLSERFQPPASSRQPLSVGIAWQGSSKYRRDRYRSIPLKEFAPLSDLAGVQLVSLQKGPGVEQLAEVNFPVLDLGNDLDQAGGAFLDTAAVMKCLDLVITSDTALAHLAGALGVPVWLALPLVPDWRWLLERSDSPWYPTMRLFRQERLDDWPGVFQAIRTALGNKLHEPAQHGRVDGD